MICFPDQAALDAYVAKRMAELDRCPHVWMVDVEGQPLWVQCTLTPGHAPETDHFNSEHGFEHNR